jgi:signal transduction histidine kinase
VGDRLAGWLTNWLPRGERIDDDAFRERHRILTWFLIAHLPLLFVFGLWRGQDPLHVLVELATPTVLATVARQTRLPRRWQGLATTAGLVYVSAVIVHFSGGTIEAHFHFFIILGFIALYQDWATFAWAIGFTLISHGVMGTLDPRAMYNHEAAINGPWKWALIHAAAVAVAAVGQLLHWRFAELERARSAELSASLVDEQTAHRASLVQLYVNLARRNQGLLSRQIEAIDALESSEADPEALERLFRLDHVTTRLRRHTESLLVLADQQTARTWKGPEPLRDVARAAVAEVEDYQRVEVRIQDPVTVAGSAIGDVTHLLAELVENALIFSPPESPVVVGGRSVEGGYLVVVEDRGLGLSDEALASANRKLGRVTALTEGIDPQLGLHVVARLAARHGIRVRLAPGRTGGTLAMVVLPQRLQQSGTDAGPSRHGMAPASPSRPAAPPAPTAEPAPTPRRTRRAAAAGRPETSRPATPASSRLMFTARASSEPAAAPPASAPPAAPPADAPAPAPRPAPGVSESGSPPATAPAPAPASAAPLWDSPLPQRVPGSNGADLPTEPVRGVFTGATHAGPDDAADRSRRLSAFQAGTAAGRAPADADTEGHR